MAMYPTPPHLLSQRLPTERSFGLFFAAVFGGLAAYGLLRHWPPGVCIALGVVSALLLCVVATAPKRLSGLNRAWFRLGLRLGALVTPLVLGLIFFGLLTPVACITRLFGRDALRLRPAQRPGAAKPVSYWLEREPQGPPQDSFKQQF